MKARFLNSTLVTDVFASHRCIGKASFENASIFYTRNNILVVGRHGLLKMQTWLQFSAFTLNVSMYQLKDISFTMVSQAGVLSLPGLSVIAGQSSAI